MRRLLVLACCLALPLSGGARAQERAAYEKLVATHAKANLVPEALVHRVIVRESKYHPDLIGRGGTIGLMQIKLGTARGVGYKGDADGLRDPDTNLAYGVKYLAGAYRAANGDHDRAVRYFAGGYYHVAKQQRLERIAHGGPALASAPPRFAKPEGAKAEDAKTDEMPKEPAKDAAAATEQPITAKPKTIRRNPVDIALPKEAAAAPDEARPIQLPPKPKKKKLAEARGPVPRPPAAIPGSANAPKPR